MLTGTWRFCNKLNLEKSTLDFAGPFFLILTIEIRIVGGLEHSAGDVSAIYVSKYNRFVDNILGRINKILKTNYDPVTVQLSSTSAKSNKKTKKIVKRKKMKAAPKSVDSNDNRSHSGQTDIAQKVNIFFQS